MFKNLILFSSLVLVFQTPINVSTMLPNGLYIWNVGQGQWVTYKNNTNCEHYDFGGEFAPWNKVISACGASKNILFLSHWDWDHFSFARKLNKRLSVCRMPLPSSEPQSQKVIAIKNIRPCELNYTPRGKQINFLQTIPPPQKKKLLWKNDASVVIEGTTYIIPGDSPQKKEKQWIRLIQQPQKMTTLILGHHGSKTSTSKQLLEALPNLHLAIASARWKKYKHPHRETLDRLRKHKIPIIRTEDWGDIYLESPFEE